MILITLTSANLADATEVAPPVGIDGLTEAIAIARPPLIGLLSVSLSASIASLNRI